jgi:hypothetical protein
MLCVDRGLARSELFRSWCNAQRKLKFCISTGRSYHVQPGMFQAAFGAFKAAVTPPQRIFSYRLQTGGRHGLLRE